MLKTPLYDQPGAVYRLQKKISCLIFFLLLKIRESRFLRTKKSSSLYLSSTHFSRLPQNRPQYIKRSGSWVLHNVCIFFFAKKIIIIILDFTMYKFTFFHCVLFSRIVCSPFTYRHIRQFSFSLCLIEINCDANV